MRKSFVFLMVSDFYNWYLFIYRFSKNNIILKKNYNTFLFYNNIIKIKID